MASGSAKEPMKERTDQVINFESGESLDTTTVVLLLLLPSSSSSWDAKTHANQNKRTLEDQQRSDSTQGLPHHTEALGRQFLSLFVLPSVMKTGSPRWRCATAAGSKMQSVPVHKVFKNKIKR